ncbi:hypothetical protein FIU93_23050 [Labrenzia sp. THAF35]|uniref:hypothetical protein n=1 Tax=Labrenzia sp. THAF35 TaxID=2587854 RepID=UPI001268AD8A|nr:hypothetical protein [Labrenzia sp. THAF35]QFT69681.1 hypothetical protein FIU93_23050 [Labrenzia sp. THAF35]
MTDRTVAEIEFKAQQRLPVPGRDVLVLVERIRELGSVLREIANSDDVDNALDPERNKRLAMAAISGGQP